MSFISTLTELLVIKKFIKKKPIKIKIQYKINLLDRKIKLGINLITYINITNKPPIYTRNSRYPYQENVIKLNKTLTHKVTLASINPKLNGWITIKHNLLKENPKDIISNKVISKN